MEDTRLIGIDLSMASPIVIEVLIEDAADPQVLREILLSNIQRPEIIRLLYEGPDVPQEIREDARKVLNLPAKMGGAPSELIKVTAGKPEQEEIRKQNILRKIQIMTIGEKIHLAIFGGRDVRTILSRDSNREVVLSVLKNPKLTENEVEMLARSRNAPEDVLRAISKDKEWMKKYAILQALVNNPKTPPGISSPMMNSLRTRDLVTLETNKNVPDSVRSSAKIIMGIRKKR